MTRFSKVLLSSLVVAVLAGTLGVGTFAGFSAETDNGTTFQSGTIVLSDSVNAGTACLSTEGGNTDTNVNDVDTVADCDALFNLSTKKPGDSGTVELQLKNVGTLAATGSVFASACTPSDASGETYHGTGDICSVLSFYIQEWDDAAHTNAVACYYGGGTATACAFDNTKTLKTFATAYSSSGTADPLSSLAANTTHYFTLGLQLDSAADNTMQGRQAAVTLKFLATQA